MSKSATNDSDGKQAEHLTRVTTKKAEDEPLPLWKYVIAGGLAGAAEILVMYPTDVLKTRAQLSSSKVSLLGTFREIIASQGVRGLYRGIAAPVLAEAPKRAWKFSANEKFKQLLVDDKGKLTTINAALAGSLSGITESLINCPFETVKVRMQSPQFANFKSSFEVLSYMIKTEGITSVYKGLEPQMLRNGVWNGAYFGVIGYQKTLKPKTPEAIAQRLNRTKAEILFEKFYTGSIASSVGTILNTPFDVVKSRMQNQTPIMVEIPGPNGDVVKKKTMKYRNSFQAITLIQAEEGTTALYKGLGARLLRLGPGGGIMIVAFEFLTDLLEPF